MQIITIILVHYDNLRIETSTTIELNIDPSTVTLESLRDQINDQAKHIDYNTLMIPPDAFNDLNSHRHS